MAGAPVLDRSQRAEIAKAARREEILNAARRVFAERGFKGTTIADIADAAGIALGTIYLYFSSKDAVFEALGQRFAQIITNALTDPINGESLQGTVTSRVDNVFEACRVNRDLVRLVVLNTDSDAAAEQRRRAAEEHRDQPMVDALTHAVAQGWIRDADPVTMTKLIIGLVNIAVYQAFVISDGGDADKLRVECGEMILAYMRPVEEAGMQP
jgi:AcrR family transcriptional regulator